MWYVLAKLPFKNPSTTTISIFHIKPPVQLTFDTCWRIHSNVSSLRLEKVLSVGLEQEREISVIDFSVVDQMCLSDEEPVCGICKLFKDHKSHPVAKISDAYAERKWTLPDIQLVLQKSECSTGSMGMAHMAHVFLSTAGVMFGFHSNDCCSLEDTTLTKAVFKYMRRNSLESQSP